MPIFQGFGRWGGLAGGGGNPNDDPHLGSVVLLLGFEGADGATATSDESPAARGAATFFNQAQLDTAQKKFGSSSLLLDGTDDRITFPDHADWTFGSSTDFTIEAWVRFNNTTGFQAVCSHWTATGPDQSWVFDKNSSHELRFAYSTDGSSTVEVKGTWGPSTGTWYHVAADKSGGTLRIYADGTMIAKATSVPSFHNSATGLRIGTAGGTAFGEVNDFNGWIDELRITRGVARYASDAGYTVPAAAFPRS